jgi:hypothetical protein
LRGSSEREERACVMVHHYVRIASHIIHECEGGLRYGGHTAAARRCV